MARKPLTMRDKQRIYSQLSPENRIACGMAARGGKGTPRKSVQSKKTKMMDDQEKLMFSVMQQHKSAQEKQINKAQHNKTREITNSNRKRRRRMKITTKIATPIEEIAKQDDYRVMLLTLNLVMLQEYPTELCNAIICRFNPEENLQLLTVLLHDELFNAENVINETTMFRSNSPTTAFISSLLRSKAKPFVAAVILPSVTFVKKLKGVSLEVDPLKLPDDPGRVKKNFQALYQLVSQTIERIHKNIYLFDDEVRSYFRIIWEKSDACIPGCGDLMVSSFVFLRFLCPAFASPKLFGVIDFDLAPSETRTMMLLMKVLQSILNNVPIKDQNLVEMDEIREKHFPELVSDVQLLVSPDVINPPKKKKSILASISSSANGKSKTKNLSFEVSPQQSEEASICLSKYICDYSPQVLQILNDDKLKAALGNLVEEITERSELSELSEVTDMSEAEFSMDLDDI